MDSGGRWFGNRRIASVVLLALAPVLVFCVDYHATDQDLSFCLFKLVTGHRCYGCGLLRGLSAVLHGDPVAAWRLNRVNAVTIPLLGYLYVKELKIVIQRKVVRPVHPLPPGEVREVYRLEP